MPDPTETESAPSPAAEPEEDSSTDTDAESENAKEEAPVLSAEDYQKVAAARVQKMGDDYAASLEARKAGISDAGSEDG